MFVQRVAGPVTPTNRLLLWITVIHLILVALLWPAAVWAQSSAQEECPGNALANPGFENGFSDRGAGEVSVANSWHPWWQDGPGQQDGYNRRPEYKPEDASRYGMRRIRSGNFAQKLFSTFSTHNAGILQQMQVTAGSKLTFSAWVQVWSSQYPDPSTVKDPGNYRVSVGIDPTGGTDWASPNVVWSEPRMEYNTWLRLEVQATAKAGTITVFLRGYPEFRNQFNDSYWDDACLIVRKPTPRPTNTPKDTSTPTSTPTPEASATPTSTPTPSTGHLCVSVFVDDNRSGQRDEGEALVAGAVLQLLDSNGMEMERYSTDGLTEPSCFSGLAPGSYSVVRQNAPGYVSTSADNVVATVEPGGGTILEFGAQFVPTPTASPTLTATVTPTPTPTPRPVLRQMGSAVYQLSGIILVALALIIPVGLHYLRKRL